MQTYAKNWNLSVCVQGSFQQSGNKHSDALNFIPTLMYKWHRKHMVYTRPLRVHHPHLCVCPILAPRPVSRCRKISVKFRWPGGDSFLHVVCCKSLASQVLLQGTKQIKIAGQHAANRTWYRRYNWKVMITVITVAFFMLSIPLCTIILNKSINQTAVQHNYLLKQIYINGGNMFRILSASHHQTLHNFQTITPHLQPTLWEDNLLPHLLLDTILDTLF
jgi:hypothetical protein